ncbi:MAG: hypothetical protein WC552_06925 [Candidatus Omnitrophota bacterium]
MRRIFVVVILVFFSILSLPGPSLGQQAAVEVNRQTVFNDITDFIATVGESAEEAKEIKAERRAERREKRQRAKNRRKKKEMKRRMKEQQRIIMEKINARNSR